VSLRGGGAGSWTCCVPRRRGLGSSSGGGWGCGGGGGGGSRRGCGARAGGARKSGSGSGGGRRGSDPDPWPRTPPSPCPHSGRPHTPPHSGRPHSPRGRRCMGASTRAVRAATRRQSWPRTHTHAGVRPHPISTIASSNRHTQSPNPHSQSPHPFAIPTTARAHPPTHALTSPHS
jgi:hypothetical protein